MGPADLIGRNDEIGEFARSVQTFIEELRKMLRDIAGGVRTLGNSSSDLSIISSKTSAGVKAVSEKSAAVAAAAEQSSANTVSVAASMEQTSSNLNSMVSATEEMSATAAEIAAQSEKARGIGGQAIV